MKNEVINISKKLGEIDEYWAPKIIEQMNDYQIKVAKFKGEFTWHDHKETDEVFMVVDGELTIEFREMRVVLKAGELYVVPRGVEHKPSAKEECQIMLIEPIGTVNTGEALSDLTASNTEWI